MRRLAPLAVLAVLAGCGRRDFNARPEAGAGATLTYPIESNVTTLDPGKVQDTDMGDVIGNVFEGLVAYDEKNRLVPRLAERWDVEDGGRTYVFHLRPARFHNGRAVAAADFVWTWERNLGKPLASPIAANYLDAIQGAKAFVEGKAPHVSGVEALDAQTLRVTLDAPRAYFLGNLTYPCTFALCKDAVGPTEIKEAKDAVGTGPFRLTNVAEGQEIDLTAFEGYWGGKPKLAKIARPIVVDAATRLNGYKNGDYDLLSLPRDEVEGVKKDPALKAQFREDPRPSIAYFLLNQKAYAPFRDERVRRAFAMSLDRNRLVNGLLTGKTVANGLIAPGVPGYRERYPGVPFDAARARRLLTEAGYPDGKGLPPLELTYRSGKPDSRLASEAAATAWRKELNVPVSPKAMEWAALLARRNKDELQMGMMSWVADYLDPQNFLSLLMTSTSKLNHDGFRDPAFDRLCAQADVSTDEASRMALYAQAETLAVEKAARLPLYFERQPMLVSSRVRGLRTNLFGIMPHTVTEVGP